MNLVEVTDHFKITPHIGEVSRDKYVYERSLRGGIEYLWGEMGHCKNAV
jgi:hypothetical protein